MASAELKDKIRRQVEFYFSESNLPKDTFLRGKVFDDPEGYVDVAIIASFKRMKQLTENVDDVVEALKDSQVVSLSPDNKRIRRNQPMSTLEEIDTMINSRSLYAKGFPVDAKLEDVEGFFSKHAKVNCVRFRRFKGTKDFKGSVFVEFATKEDAEKVLSQSITYSQELGPVVLKWKTAYEEEKRKEKQEKKQGKLKQKVEEEMPKFDKETLVRLSNVSKADFDKLGQDVRKIRDLLTQKFGKVAFIETDKLESAQQLVIRFADAKDAAKAVADKEIALDASGSPKYPVTEFSDEEYQAFLQATTNSMIERKKQQQQQQQQPSKKGGKRGNFKKRGGNFKGDGESSNKKQKTE